jgi:hypothetical protein
MGLISQVDTNLWRGPQPTEELWSELQDLDVKTAVKLNYPSEGEDVPAAGRYGILVREFPMPPSGVADALADALAAPDDTVVLSALEAMRDTTWNRGGAVYVHCLHGHDRTGLLVGLYRVKVMGWTVADAYAEMRAMGFHRLLHGLMETWERLSASAG